jgi:hypothetical protein
MMVNIVEINNCKHYLINEGGSEKLYFFDTSYMVERDFDINHPFGNVYKPKHVIDTPIRFVRQKDNSAFIFKATEWNKESNPFMFKKVNEEFYLLKKISKVIFNG